MVQLRPQGWNVWQVTYNVPDAPTTWYSDVTDKLEAHGWQSLDTPAYGALSRTYTHGVSCGVVELSVWVHFSFNPFQPRVARILIRHSLALA